MSAMYWWFMASGIAGLYCIARAIFDLRQKHYIWGVIGLVAGGILLLTPVQTHAVKIDLPMSETG